MSASGRRAFAWRVERRFPLSACRTPAALGDPPVAGVKRWAIEGDDVHVIYDLRTITLRQLGECIGFDAGTLGPGARLRWAFERYRESIRADDLKYIGGWDNIVREIYVSHYRQRQHGRRDYRRRQWRQYEERRAQPRTPSGDARENSDG